MGIKGGFRQLLKTLSGGKHSIDGRPGVEDVAWGADSVTGDQHREALAVQPSTNGKETRVQGISASTSRGEVRARRVAAWRAKTPRARAQGRHACATSAGCYSALRREAAPLSRPSKPANSLCTSAVYLARLHTSRAASPRRIPPAPNQLPSRRSPPAPHTAPNSPHPSHPSHSHALPPLRTRPPSPRASP